MLVEELLADVGVDVGKVGRLLDGIGHRNGFLFKDLYASKWKARLYCISG